MSKHPSGERGGLTHSVGGKPSNLERFFAWRAKNFLTGFLIDFPATLWAYGILFGSLALFGLPLTHPDITLWVVFFVISFGLDGLAAIVKRSSVRQQGRESKDGSLPGGVGAAGFGVAPTLPEDFFAIDPYYGAPEWLMTNGGVPPAASAVRAVDAARLAEADIAALAARPTPVPDQATSQFTEEYPGVRDGFTRKVGRKPSKLERFVAWRAKNKLLTTILIDFPAALLAFGVLERTLAYFGRRVTYRETIFMVLCIAIIRNTTWKGKRRWRTKRKVK